MRGHDLMKNTFQVFVSIWYAELVFIITAAYEPECGSVHVAHASVGSMMEGGESAGLLP